MSVIDPLGRGDWKNMSPGSILYSPTDKALPDWADEYRALELGRAEIRLADLRNIVIEEWGPNATFTREELILLLRARNPNSGIQSTGALLREAKKAGYFDSVRV